MLKINTISQRHAKTCPYCRDEIPANEQIASCTDCCALIHVDCWQEHPQCMICQCKHRQIVTLTSAGEIVVNKASHQSAPVTYPSIEKYREAASRTQGQPHQSIVISSSAGPRSNRIRLSWAQVREEFLDYLKVVSICVAIFSCCALVQYFLPPIRRSTLISVPLRLGTGIFGVFSALYIPFYTFIYVKRQLGFR